jgi:hypothetical protein
MRGVAPPNLAAALECKHSDVNYTPRALAAQEGVVVWSLFVWRTQTRPPNIIFLNVRADTYGYSAAADKQGHASLRILSR